jgi:hypothetical protein
LTWSGSLRVTRDARVGRARGAASLSSVVGKPRIVFGGRVRIGCCSPPGG